MCGIVGIARSAHAPAIDAQWVQRMADRIVHRGPDDAGYYSTDQVALGMRRLSIIDLAGGHQPIANEDETLWLVCNGEIYNFQSVRSQLEQRGHRFRTGSDVEVLLHLYEEYGDAFLDHVSGMFALALWDSRRQRLIIARDRLGMKPLYYSVVNGCLVFASEVKALLALPFLSAEVDRDSLAEYLGMGYAVAPRSIFRNVQKLPPATRATWDAKGLKLDRYWSLPEVVQTKLSEDDWIELLRTELRRAVREHMVSDVPIGAFLSGGIDSSAVVALMAAESSGPINTYSIGYTGDKIADYYNELSYAAAVARRFGTRHTEIPVAPEVSALLPRLLWHVEEPISDSAMLTTYLVSELAARSVKVILSGVGGDELFAGYPRYLGDRYGQLYRRIPRFVRRGVIMPLALALPSGRQNRMMDLARYARKFISAHELPWRQQYRMLIEACSGQQVAALLAGGSAGQDGFDRLLEQESAEDPLLRLLRIDAPAQLSEDLLLLTDKVTMATSIECRVPFLDHKLVELGASIPAAVKLRRRELKYILKKAMHGILPEEIIYRRKRGFGAPVGAWFKQQLRGLRDGLLNRRTVESRGLLHWPAVELVLRAHDANREDYSDLLLTLINLEIWCRLFVDGRAATDIGDELRELTLAA